MDRLEQQADDLASQDDPEGAAQAIGKAAMMAKIIAQQHGQVSIRSLFESVEKFFRGQEYAYRALSIFEQTGGRPPAPHGVCSYLEQAEKDISQTHVAIVELKNLEQTAEFRQQGYISDIKNWEAILQELKNDLAC